jgi:outer membrane protein assembly factor BamB
MASETEKGLPDWFSPGSKLPNGDVDPDTAKNVKWVAYLGQKTYGSPVVSQGRVFIGTKYEDSAVLCFDEQTGKLVGRFVCRTSRSEADSFGVCSTPTVEGDRLYFVAPYPEVVCLDVIL